MCDFTAQNIIERRTNERPTTRDRTRSGITLYLSHFEGTRTIDVCFFFITSEFLSVYFTYSRKFNKIKESPKFTVFCVTVKIFSFC